MTTSSPDDARGVADLSFTNAAVADLGEIDEYSLARFGEEAGEAYMRGFDAAFALLRTHPHAGAAVSEYGKGYRCLVHQRHRIFYRPEQDRVLIVRIIHHARDAMAVLKKAAK